MAIHLLLPDAWRIELMRRPLEADAWLSALAAWPRVKLVDWAAPRPAAGEVVLVAHLDLAAAEFLLKLPPEVTVVAVETHGQLPVLGGRGAFLARGWARVQRRLALSQRGHTLPLAPVPWLATLMRAAGVSS